MQRALHPGMSRQLADYYTTSRNEVAGLWPYEGMQAGSRHAEKLQTGRLRVVNNRQQQLGNQQEGSRKSASKQKQSSNPGAGRHAGRQPDRLQVDGNMQVAKQALGSQEEVAL
jgi:hypothetical protein